MSSDETSGGEQKRAPIAARYSRRFMKAFIARAKAKRRKGRNSNETTNGSYARNARLKKLQRQARKVRRKYDVS